MHKKYILQNDPKVTQRYHLLKKHSDLDLGMRSRSYIHEKDIVHFEFKVSTCWHIYKKHILHLKLKVN